MRLRLDRGGQYPLRGRAVGKTAARGRSRGRGVGEIAFPLRDQARTFRRFAPTRLSSEMTDAAGSNSASRARTPASGRPRMTVAATSPETRRSEDRRTGCASRRYARVTTEFAVRLPYALEHR